MNVRSILVPTILAFAASITGTHAAPQVLGVMSSAEPVPMTCEDGQCGVELSAFCLEQGRVGPKDGTAYRAVDPVGLTLVATREDGSITRAPASPYLSFQTSRGYTAVRATASDTLLSKLGARALSLAVGPDLVLAPIAEADDPQPLTDVEISEATHTYRAIAADMFDDGNRPQVVTAVVLNRLINALPRAASPRTIDLASRDGLWGQVIGGVPRLDDADIGKAQAALVFESCRRGATYVQGLTVRRCLEASHDALMSTMNSELWQVLGAGS